MYSLGSILKLRIIYLMSELQLGFILINILSVRKTATCEIESENHFSGNSPKILLWTFFLKTIPFSKFCEQVDSPKT